MSLVNEQPKEDIVGVLDVEQGSDEWRRVRMGMLTASEFHKVMVNSGERVQRTKLLYRLAGEILTGEPAETYKNAAMERGNAMEAAACERYAFHSTAPYDTITKVGFVLRTFRTRFRDITVGASPDRFVGDDGILEVKTMIPELLIPLAKKGAFPTEHTAQCQGQLWVTGRKWVDLVVYYKNMPIMPVFRVERNEPYIRQMVGHVEAFAHELDALVRDVPRLGGPAWRFSQ